MMYVCMCVRIGQVVEIVSLWNKNSPSVIVLYKLNFCVYYYLYYFVVVVGVGSYLNVTELFNGTFPV